MKADAYGLGMERWRRRWRSKAAACSSPPTWTKACACASWCRGDSTIYVLHGPPPGATAEFFQYDLVPVLNDPGQVRGLAPPAASWAPPAGALQFDTGMSRMGLAECRRRQLADPAWKDELQPVLVMSHLACADEPGIR
jgi:alanine racemase